MDTKRINFFLIIKIRKESETDEENEKEDDL